MNNDESYLIGLRTIEIFNNISRQNREHASKPISNQLKLSKAQIRAMKQVAESGFGEGLPKEDAEDWEISLWETVNKIHIGKPTKNALLKRGLITINGDSGKYSEDGYQFTELGLNWCKENLEGFKG